METQNLVISFDYSWFFAKNLAYAECNSTTETHLVYNKFDLIVEV